MGRPVFKYRKGYAPPAPPKRAKGRKPLLTELAVIETLLKRFYRHHTPTSPSECWEWGGSLCPNGYGMLAIKSARDGIRDYYYVKAHRFSFALHTGREPNDLYVCHKCDNPKCVNPHHLFLGTPKVNTRDCIRKQRNRTPSGQNHPHARLTEADVATIRDRIAGGENNTEIAADYDVSHGQISNIRRGKSWAA